MVAAESADTPVTDGGADGGTLGTAPSETVEEGDVPVEFVAVTVNVYVVEFVNPDTTHEVEDVVQVLPSGVEVTVYEVTGELPVAPGIQPTST